LQDFNRQNGCANDCDLTNLSAPPGPDRPDRELKPLILFEESAIKTVARADKECEKCWQFGSEPTGFAATGEHASI
jgi:hypothetical protein